jgi:hypothetical protein
LLLFHSKSLSERFVGWEPGWLTGRSAGPGFCFFWWLNWSVFLPLALWAVAKTRARREPLFWAALVLFTLASLIRFQPWDWDNTKIFAWSYFLLAPAVIEALSPWWENEQRGSRVLVSVLFLSMTLTGFLELSRLLRTERNTYVMFNPAEVTLARTLVPLLTPGDRVLVVDDHHDWVSALAGGQILAGYDGWLGSWGFHYEKQKRDVATMFGGGEEARRLIREYGITYAVISPDKMSRYKTDEPFFHGYPLVHELAGIRVYRISP